MDKKYVRCANPNKAKFAELLDRARGRRTMKKFAEDCGVNPSTFSRIYNQSNKGASSEELIRIIAENADPESEVTLDMLMEANGFIPEGSMLASRHLQEMLEEETYHVLQERLLEIPNAKVIVEPNRYRICKSMSIRPDIVIDGLVIDGKQGEWLIDIMVPTANIANSSMGFDERRFNFHISRRVQERIGRYLEAFCAVDENAVINRISLAIPDEQIYELVLDYFGHLKTNDSISILLIDLDSKTIEEEYVLEDRNGKRGESLISKPKKPKYQIIDDDMDGLFWEDDSEE